MQTVAYEIPAGDHGLSAMTAHAARMIGLARGMRTEVAATWNGWSLKANAEDTPMDVLRGASICSCCGETFATPAVFVPAQREEVAA